MPNADIEFVHLHVHTQYSLLDGAIRIDPLLERVIEFGMDSVAITDHGTMFGVFEFFEKAKKAGIKPIIGCECYVAPRSIKDKTPQDHKGLSHLILLAENQEGYRNLCRLASIGQLEGFYYKPRIDKTLLKEYHKGLIGLSACLQGEIPKIVQTNRHEDAENAVREYLDILGEGNFFLEVQNNGIESQDVVNQALLELGQKLSLPLVASNDCHYLDKEDVRAHDVLLCIQTAKTIYDKERLKFRTDQLYFKPKEEMYADFKDYPNALDNAVDIAKRCDLSFDLNTYHFPNFETDLEGSTEDLFEKKVRKGFESRIKIILKKKEKVEKKIYQDRLEDEIGIILSMGFAGYFLIVADFIHYAKEKHIPVGPGRGSAAGSLVAYSLGITDLDPLEYGLIFERFLNPARKSMPDIDVDFCINGREEVFKYVVDKYGGGDYVAQIITFGKLKTRAVIRDVGRALDIPLREVDMIAKCVPDVLNISLNSAIKSEPRLKEMIKTRSEVADLMKICRVLEGLPRHASTHAAGVVISDRPLMEYLPLYRGKKGEVVTQFDMTCVEKIGLVKFDFLGLRNLTVIESTLTVIKAQGKEAPDITSLNLKDPDTYRLLASGDTNGVFQLESSGMKDLLIRLKPETFEDVIALVALYRPGPLDSGMVEDFVERKHGKRTVEYLTPELEPILKETYGVIVYQEQVMKIAGTLAKYSMAEADDLRKAMGKKIPQIMATHRQRFLKGASNNGIAAGKAEKIFDLIEKFGGYGFNKSHSAAYALIAFQTAFLKTHYTVEFMTSLLTSEMQSTDGIVKYIAECRSHDLEILPPDINESDKEFTVSGSKIRFGLKAVKNVGEGAIDSIIEVRQEAKFRSIFDFCERVNWNKINKRVVESLIKCGAFDSTGEYRSRTWAVLEDALDYGQRVQKERLDPQIGLFETDANQQAVNTPQMPEIEEWDEKQRLAFEKESLGFYVSGHPMTRYQNIMEKFANADSASLKEFSDTEAVRIGGVVSNVKTIMTKKGDQMAFVTLEDLYGSIEATLFSSVYPTVSDILVEDNPILIQGNVQRDEKSLKLLADMVIPMEKAEETWTASVQLTLDNNRTDEAVLLKLHDILKRYPGSCKTFINLQGSEKTKTIIALPDSIKVRAGASLTREVNDLCGYKALETVCSPIRPSR
ncbi:MAG: DNA polymerase III subunit alpha [Desulfobacterales bacterium]